MNNIILKFKKRNIFSVKLILVIIGLFINFLAQSQGIRNLNYYRAIYYSGGNHFPTDKIYIYAAKPDESEVSLQLENISYTGGNLVPTTPKGIEMINSKIIEQLRNSNLLISESNIELESKFDKRLILRCIYYFNFGTGGVKINFYDSADKLVYSSEVRRSAFNGFKKALIPFEKYRYRFNNSLELKYKSIAIENSISSNLNSSSLITEKKKTKIELSDIDINIPSINYLNTNTFVVLIGNENYQNEISVKYAINDATILNEYFIKTMGVPSEQVHLIIDASYGKILREIEWMKDIAKVFNGEAKLVFYYAGHGMPDEKTKGAYILPIDGEASTTVTAIKLDDIYSALNKYPTKQTTVILDACFSGVTRDGMLATGRGVRIIPKKSIPKGNLVVFSAVSSLESAHPYESKTHGLFSYYFMKKIQETKGDVTYGELSDYIKKEVGRRSVINGEAQTPSVNVSMKISESWQDWTFK